jgi:D-alanyl-lipoteichoic acid acyltransferase DltB (MBOAT superfamily)
MPLPLLLSFPLFFCLYWYGFGKRLRLQNALLLVGSYAFYAVWDWRFLPLLAAGSLLHYFLGLGIHRATRESTRRLGVAAGVLQALGCLLFFKYSHPFLPLGLSFYTFRMLSYLLDVKRGRIEPTRDWVVFFSYIAFFPCIIAGPIDRPGSFLPQLESERTFVLPEASDNMRRILWGLFKKIAIADNCANFTSDIFIHYTTLPGISLCIGAFLYTIEIYADFSGYSDMAVGVAGLLGFRVAKNFNFPFFAQNIAEFWRRWHITLTSWLTDYVFTPLSIFFRDLGKPGLVIAILVTFTLIGAWHGPRWTFVLFGVLHGCYFIPLLLRGRRPTKAAATGRPHSGRVGISLTGRIGGMAATFLLVMAAFVLFRSETPSQALGYYRRLFTAPFLNGFSIYQKVNVAATATGIGILLAAEWIQQDKDHVLQLDLVKSPVVRTLIYYSLIGFILLFSPAKFADFIYIHF